MLRLHPSALDIVLRVVYFVAVLGIGVAARRSVGTSADFLLAGRAPGVSVDRGPIVCVCFDVGARTIIDAIRQDGLADVAAVGAALRAGTNCGSCRPAIARLIAEHPRRQEAANAG